MGYKYPLVLLGLLAGGDLALVPLVYSTHVGVFSYYELILLVLVSELWSDLVWYAVGRFIREERLYKIPYLKHRPHIIERTSEFFKSRDMQILFTSKFVYGTRIATQILCGAHRMRFLWYLAVNLGGMLLWTLILMGIVSAVGLSVSSLEDAALKLQVSLLLIGLLVVAFLLLVKKFAKNPLQDR